MPKERVIEAKLEDDCYKRQRNREQRQNAEVTGVELAGIDRHQHQPKRAVNHATDAED
jgi:hypothetical protein